MSKNHGQAGVVNPGQSDDLLIEIGCEELPPKSLNELREALFAAVTAGLTNDSFSFDAAASRAFSSPRRLALYFKAVAAQQPDQHQQRRGPALSAAFDPSGQPGAAAQGFARSVGVTVGELETLETSKGSWLVANIHVPGKTLAQLIFPILQQAVHQLPIPKPMRWSDHDFSFVRPVHWLLVLHGNHVLHGELLGQTAGDKTRGHRIHAPGPLTLPRAADYLEALRGAFVLADQDQRMETIREQLLSINPATRIDPDLLAEVTNLVEWPVAIECAFDEGFLAIPHEVLIASMQQHQKFFPISNTRGVSNHFIAVANLASTDMALVQEGFERVIRPRLADARFFLEEDHKKTLDSYLESLNMVLFQQKIGSVGDKSRRMASLSKKIASFLSADETACARAGLLAKCDLMTQMVAEFPELQGIMGRYYALHSGESVEVADSIEQHYLPRFAGDAIPPGIGGQVVGLADRIDTLVAIFAAGLKPSGNKDPFALRRSALGLVRILLEARLEITPQHLLDMAASEFSVQGTDVDPGLLSEVSDFIIERARSYFRETGHGAEVISAALASPWGSLPDLQARLEALSGFLGQESGLSLAAANKRIGNILRKTAGEVGNTIREDRLILMEEQHLFSEVMRIEEILFPLLAQSDYAACLEHLSQLRPGVDRFFEGVMVMDEDAGLRHNRLALLARLKGLFDQIADLSVLG